MTLLEITNDLINISKELNIEGPSVEALIRLLAKAIYDNELCTTNLVLESSLSRSRNINSRITAAADLGYSVFRGNNQRVSFKNLKYIENEGRLVNKFDVLANVGRNQLVYLDKYELNKESFNGNNSPDLNCIITREVATVTSTISEDNKFVVYFPLDNISGDILIKVNGEEVSYQEGLFYGKNGDGDYSTEDATLCVVTISGFGICIINRNHDNDLSFKVGDVVELTYLEYLPENIDISNLKSIDGFDYDSLIDYEISNYLPRNDSADSIYYNALTNFRNGYTIKSDDDIKSIIENYFSRYITGCNIKKYYTSDNYTTVLVPAVTPNRIDAEVIKYTDVPSEIKIMNSNSRIIELTKDSDNNDQYILFDGIIGDSNSIVIDNVKIGIKSPGYEYQEVSMVFNEGIGSLEFKYPGTEKYWIFKGSILGNILKITLSNLDKSEAPINLVSGSYLTLNVDYKSGSSELSESFSENYYIITTDYGDGDTRKLFINGEEVLPEDVFIYPEILYKNRYKKVDENYFQYNNGNYLKVDNEYVEILAENRCNENHELDPEGDYLKVYNGVRYLLTSDQYNLLNASNINISYNIESQYYGFVRSDDNLEYKLELPSEDSITYVIRREDNDSSDDNSSMLYKNLYLYVKNIIDLSIGNIIVNYIKESSINIKYYDENNNRLNNEVFYYNCDEGKFVNEDIDGVICGSGEITIPKGSNEKLWIIQLAGLNISDRYVYISSENRYNRSGSGTSADPYVYTPKSNGSYLKVDEEYIKILAENRYKYENNEYIQYNSGDYLKVSGGYKYRGIYKIDDEDEGREFIYGPGNLLHVDVYYSNELDQEIDSDIVIPDEKLIPKFKKMIKTVYYVENVSFNFKLASNLSVLSTDQNNPTVVDEFSSGYPLKITIHYSYNNSISSIRSKLDSLLSKYKFKIGEDFNLYELLSNIQDIDGVKYVNIDEFKANPYIEVPDDKYLEMDGSLIKYSPVNDITKNLRYSR